MSFVKITDPAKTDFLVKEFLKTRDNVRKNYLSERTGELDTQRELSKFFKPVVESQKTIAKEISEPVTNALLPIKDGIQKAVELKIAPR